METTISRRLLACVLVGATLGAISCDAAFRHLTDAELGQITGGDVCLLPC